MNAPESSEITSLLQAWGRGDDAALERLTPLIYQDLLVRARRYARHERGGATLQGTALVHEAYLRLLQAREVDWHDRSHFFAVASRIMRRILVDAARARRSDKRGGDVLKVDHADFDLEQVAGVDTNVAAQLCALDDALAALTELDSRRAQVIELRFFGGLTVEQTADALQVSAQTVMRDWRLAKAWLMRELRR